MRYGIVGRTTRTLLTYQGRILIHGNKAELEFLFPAERVVNVPFWYTDTMLIKDHPDMAPVRWPLNKEDFR